MTGEQEILLEAVRFQSSESRVRSDEAKRARDQRDDAITGAYNAGLSTYSIEAASGVTAEQVRRILHRRGVKPREGGRA